MNFNLPCATCAVVAFLIAAEMDTSLRLSHCLRDELPLSPFPFPSPCAPGERLFLRTTPQVGQTNCTAVGSSSLPCHVRYLRWGAIPGQTWPASAHLVANRQFHAMSHVVRPRHLPSLSRATHDAGSLGSAPQRPFLRLPIGAVVAPGLPQMRKFACPAD